MKWLSFSIQDNDAGKRLDSICKKLLPKLSFSVLMKKIRKRAIRINKKRSAPNAILNVGDFINIAPFLQDFLQEAIAKSPFKKDAKLTRAHHHQFDVLYNNNGFFIINKAMGQKIFPARTSGTVANFLAETFPSSMSFAPSPCHRLDTGTSGVLVNAYTLPAAQRMHKLQKEKSFIKLYIAVLTEKLLDTLLIHNLYRDNTKKITYAYDTKINIENANNVRALGTAHTCVLYLYSCNYKNTRVHIHALALTGGKTHQIRSQCAAAGAPLYKDYKYMSIHSDGASCFFLHAWAVFCKTTSSDQSCFPNIIAPIPHSWYSAFNASSLKTLERKLWEIRKQQNITTPHSLLSSLTQP